MADEKPKCIGTVLSVEYYGPSDAKPYRVETMPMPEVIRFTQEEERALQEAIGEELCYKWSAVKLAPLESALAKIRALLPPK